ncbi:hypothetical protein MBLNU457_6120t1 [Dothideomycetes sp. NU457]
MTTNKAAWLLHKQQHPFTISTAPMPVPKPNQVLIRAHAIAINPCDWVIQTAGVLISSFPKILGEDVSGTIVSVGSNITSFAPGDRVCGSIDVTESDDTQGTFQLYSAVNEGMLARIPSSVSFVEAAVLPAGLTTAACSLYPDDAMGLPLPKLEPESNGKTLVVWAASTVVGSCAIQLAIASGFEVFATAGKANQEYCRELGAVKVFDHSSETVVEDMLAALEGRDVQGGFCAHVDAEAVRKCAVVVHGAGAKKLGTVLPPGWPVPEGVPAGLDVSFCYYSTVQRNKVGPAIWGQWLTPALASGLMRCKPDPFVIGQGLESLQAACDKVKAGVSAMKVCVEIP